MIRKLIDFPTLLAGFIICKLAAIGQFTHISWWWMLALLFVDQLDRLLLVVLTKSGVMAEIQYRIEHWEMRRNVQSISNKIKKQI